MENYLRPLKYEDGKFLILDQTLLPGEERWTELQNEEEFWDAINTLKVRGAPAIGVAAAFGMAISLRGKSISRLDDFVSSFEKIKEYIASSRPTAVNLFWALDRMDARMTTDIDAFSSAIYDMDSAMVTDDSKIIEKVLDGLFNEAENIRKEDVNACRSMGEHGLTLLEPGMGILTHCNAGALATAGYGTCLSPIYLGHEQGYDFRIYADETRPLLQGARLTAWELSKAGVNVTLICDNMVSSVMKRGLIDAVVVGCDRMAANGDAANKIGTSGVAILAKEYGIPFYIYVPTSTIDPKTKTGDEIPIEDRDGSEIYSLWYREKMAPSGISTYNPAFDVTDHKYITAVITEKGIIYPPYSF